MNVDMSVVYLLGIIGIVIAMVIGVTYLQKKNLVSRETLNFVSTVLGISVEILDEMDLKNEKELLKITSIVQDSLNFAIGMFDSQEDIYDEACAYAFNLCEQAGIPMNDNRINIVKQLIKLGLEIKVVNE